MYTNKYLFKFMEKSYFDNETNTLNKKKDSTRRNYILKSEIFRKPKNDKENSLDMANKKDNQMINYYKNSIIFNLNKTELTISKNNISESKLNNQLKGNLIIDQLQQKEQINSPIRKEENNTNTFWQNDEEKKYNNYNNFLGSQNYKKETTLIKNICNNITLNQYFLNMNNGLPQERNEQRIPHNPIGNQIVYYPQFIIKDKYCCLAMKNFILSNPSLANEKLFPQISNQIKQLCLDKYGNFFLQDFLDILTFDNLNSFLNIIQPGFTEICISPHGARVIQKIIEKINASPLLINKFIFILNSKDLGIICKAQYGNFIIQKYLLTIQNPEYTNFIYNYIFQNFFEIANLKHGVCVVQKCIAVSNEVQRRKLFALILKDLITLIQNEYGNYLIQYILVKIKDEKYLNEILPILLKIEENLVNLCMSKYSANTLEKCFENSENFIRNHIIDSLLLKDCNSLIEVFFNEYGIYVLLKACKCNNGLYKEKLKECFKNKIKDSSNFVLFNTRKNKKISHIIDINKELKEIYNVIETNINIKLNKTHKNK